MRDIKEPRFFRIPVNTGLNLGSSENMIYSLPFRKNKKVRICDAPFHKKRKYLRNCFDFYMTEGTPILAAQSGVVLNVVDKYKKTYKNPKYANRVNLVIISHKDGKKSVYVHLKHKSSKLKKGDFVKKGQIIALSGQTGYATYPHLHFGVYKGKDNIKIKLKDLESIKFKSYKEFEK